MDQNSRIVVGVNKFEKENEELEIPILEIGHEAEEEQIASLEKLRAERDQSAVDSALEDVQKAAGGKDNLLPPIIAAAKAYATMGEIVEAMKQEFGEWQESAVF